ncbi:DNA primase small subunit [Methanosarcina lacustris Z-7289]|uniref:DNA primase small subunit PriS n=1 Tax=Methanosarcina lacustris Z-7289 TaxID=1434111 RepID=A0A0E3WQJ5_9EURY|nr:DNA primase catalytic subunit PriS [Methanosarcina lacustris]AKB73735.1 DNA primase small subunit [Methanosarcina lacustris Z-7289]
MDNRTTRYLKSCFQNYYKTAEIGLPDHLLNREWAFIFYDDMPEKMMHRHKSFGSPGEALDYLYGMAPAHVYNSTAYYEYPDAKKMNEKNWLGAELIFDLDADHLPNAPNNYADMLELVKKETFKLIDFLLDDFGFSEQEIELVFSGGRGYHLHVTNPKVLKLGSSERREIVNYISGRDVDFKYFFKEVAMDGDFGTGSKAFKGIKNVPVKCTLVGYDSGWGKRIALYLTDYMKTECRKKYRTKMFPELRRHEKVGETTIKKLINITNSENGLNDILERGRLDFDVRNFKEIASYFMQESVEDFLHRFGASVDEPVTADIKRLIRVPGSLHGGSGMLVKKLALSELERFDPLNDAVIFSDKPTKITVSKPFSIQLKGKDLRIEEGIQEVPEYAAVYLICRGVAEYGHRKNQPNTV